MTYDTSLVDRARARRQRRPEPVRKATLRHLIRLLDEHAAAFGLSDATIFGSVTRPGRFREASDVDIAVERIGAEAFFEAMSLLSTELGRPVDLVRLSECHFAEGIRERGMRWTRMSSYYSHPT